MEIEIGGRSEKSLGGQEWAAVNQECVQAPVQFCPVIPYSTAFFFFFLTEPVSCRGQRVSQEKPEFYQEYNHLCSGGWTFSLHACALQASLPSSLQVAVANRLRRRTSDQTVLGSNPAVAAALSPWTRLFTPIGPRRSLHISFYQLSGHPCKIYTGKKKKKCKTQQHCNMPYTSFLFAHAHIQKRIVNVFSPRMRIEGKSSIQIGAEVRLVPMMNRGWNEKTETGAGT